MKGESGDALVQVGRLPAQGRAGNWEHTTILLLDLASRMVVAGKCGTSDPGCGTPWPLEIARKRRDWGWLVILCSGLAGVGGYV
jgi:hypothetical protein